MKLLTRAMKSLLPQIEAASILSITLAFSRQKAVSDSHKFVELNIMVRGALSSGRCWLEFSYAVFIKLKSE